MAANKRLQDLTDYTSVLPYASEIVGVYQPLIGWKSARKINRIKDAVRSEKIKLLSLLGRNLIPPKINFDQDHLIRAADLWPARIAGQRLTSHDSIVMQQIQLDLERFGVPADMREWSKFIREDYLTKTLQINVLEYYNNLSLENGRRIGGMTKDVSESDEAFKLRIKRLLEESKRDIQSAVEDETIIAGVLKLLLDKNRIRELKSIFFTNLDAKAEATFDDVLAKAAINLDDPYLTFDPKRGVKDVSLSPIGIVHLFRQYFFELDTFLGTPVGHVWLSPGSTVELIEISTRRTYTEKIIEQALETIVKSEKSTTDQDELSEAVKEDNKNDLKIGASVTVNQRWGTGDASATASLNMDQTQQTARETTHKKMRQQSEKLSTEIRESYKTTFKTISEVTDVSSKRHTFTNSTGKLINYELRRKMRQVAVQVQDIGSYLCWETFVDDLGADLGLANLVHIAKPADLLPVPDMTTAVAPADRWITFRANASWIRTTKPAGFIQLTTIDIPPAPEGMRAVIEKDIIELKQDSFSGEDLNEYSSIGPWKFGAKFLPGGQQLEIGIIAEDDLDWDDNLNFVLAGALRYTATDAKIKEIEAANTAKVAAKEVATHENERRTKEDFIKAAKERVELAAGITRRAYEDLREEERIIVYRRLITSLMWSYNYSHADNRSRHVLAELINSIFDIEKMLYFVAPEWWKPRKRATLSIYDLQNKLDESVVTWSDGPLRKDNYFITEKSAPAPMGSSLGWLLQLDGDNLRNAFLNAPWVKAVIPIRPGKEMAAISWLQNVEVEGTEGLGPKYYYYAPPDELAQIRKGLNDHGIAVGEDITLRNAIDFLCIEVAEKHNNSNKTKKFPDTELNDDNKVTSTPIEKVFEHGFYPLKGGFRVDPIDDPKNPLDTNNRDRHFQVFDQWIEILPTDQVAPVEVEYDPKTGRQK